jgi:hypothetical protein
MSDNRLRVPPSGAFNNLPGFPGEVPNVNVGAVASIAWSKGAAQKLTLSQNANVSSLGLPPGQTTWVQLKVVQGGGGGFVPTFVGAKTPGGTPLAVSAAAGAVDLLNGFWDGSTLYVAVGALALS